MAEVIRMPQLSDTMEEGVISRWLKKEGDKVSSGDILAEVETDKATMEMESFEEGTLLHIGVKEGESVPVDQVIAVIGEKGEDYKQLLEEEKQSAPDNTEKKEDTKPSDDDSASPKKEKDASKSKEQAENGNGQKKQEVKTATDGRIKASPLAKRMAKENDIDITLIEGSGDYGRIVKKDIERYLEKGPDLAAGTAPVTGAEEGYEDVRVSQMRKTIANRLSESKFSAPHYYLNVDVNMEEAVRARKQLNELTGEEDKVSFNDLVIKAASLALKRHPEVNASWLGDKMRYYKHVHIGVAVAVEEGLLVPVIRHADQKGISTIAREVRQYAKKAQNKELEPKDWEGNTFTVSNLGMFGIDDFTAIINPPDACIMAVGAIKEQPVSVNGEIRSANMMRVTLSCDHRIVDGAKGARFLDTFRRYLEAPVSMLA